MLYEVITDTFRKAKTEGKTWLAQLEEEEKEKTGIKNLKIKYNKVFGYYLEVTNSYLSLVPEDYIRKQTLSNAERYTTKRLKELEDMILNAEDKLFAVEYDIYCSIRDHIADELERIQKTAKAIAKLDVFTNRITSYNVCYTKLLRATRARLVKTSSFAIAFAVFCIRSSSSAM